MFFCTKCGNQVHGSPKFCPNCGNELNIPENNVSGIEEREALVSEFVGPNHGKLKDKKFSWSTFFMGTTYFFYRKMYVNGLIYWAITYAINLITDGLGSLAISIIAACMFKDLYYKFANAEIDKVLANTQDMSLDDKMYAVRKKGGVHKFWIYIYFIVPALLLLAIIFFVLIFSTKMNTY